MYLLLTNINSPVHLKRVQLIQLQIPNNFHADPKQNPLTQTQNAKMNISVFGRSRAAQGPLRDIAAGGWHHQRTQKRAISQKSVAQLGISGRLINMYIRLYTYSYNQLYAYRFS